MRKLKRNFFIYCITNFIWVAVFNLWYDFLPKFYEVLGASIITVGLLFSLERVFEGFSNVFGGYFADRYGRKKIIIFGSFIGNISILILFLVTNWLWLIPAIVFFWITVGVQSPTIAALINESISKKRRASAFSILSVTGLIPAILTVFLGGLLIEKIGLLNGIRISLLISFIIGIASTLVYILFLKETLKFPKKIRIKIKRELSRKIWYFMISYGLLMFGVSLVSPFVIFYSQDIVGIDMFEWGIIRSFFTAFTLIATIAGGTISDRFGRKTALLLSFISIIFPFLMIVSKNLIHIIVAHMFAGALFLGSSSITVYVFEKSKFAKSIGIVNLSLAIAMVLGYPIGGFLYSLSPEYPFIASGLVRIAGLILGILLI
jgi:DHA1 family multidrug resistance protein-like MFS transporter